MTELTVEEQLAELAAAERREKEIKAAIPKGLTKVAGWLVPESDVLLAARLAAGSVAGGRATYNIRRLMRALSYCGNFRGAIDVGAHVGLMSFWLRHFFVSVIAFEPHPENMACLLENCYANLDPAEDPFGQSNFIPIERACGSKSGKAKLHGATSEKQHLDFEWRNFGIEVEVETLDSESYIAIDFLKIDCEGYELEVIRGAAETIEKWQPVIMVEQKPKMARKRYGLEDQGAIDELVEFHRYSLEYEENGDFILCPTKKPA